MQNIPRKAVGRKPVNGSVTPATSFNGPSTASPPSTLASSGAPAQGSQAFNSLQAQPLLQHPAPSGYFELPLHTRSPIPTQPNLPSSVQQYIHLSQPHQAPHTTPGPVLTAPVEYNSAPVISPAPSSTPTSSLETVRSPSVPLYPISSNESTFTPQSTLGSWPGSPGSLASYQTNITTPLSRMSTGPGGDNRVHRQPSVARSISQSSSGSVARDLPACSQCKASILANVSVFECLICSTGTKTTKFCVYCYTTGEAAKGHSNHDPSFYVTESDPAVQPEPNAKVGSVNIPSVPGRLWITRKSATGRIWYQHRVTGFRTHLRPFLATVPPAPVAPGWMAHQTPDGKTYYFNASTGKSSWELPMAQKLPSGWREVRTPDCVPFYVHDDMQLTCWERPGESPASYSSASRGAKGVSSTHKSKKSTSTAVHGVAAAGAATTLTASVAAMADAADLSPQGILSATVAAAKLTHHGAKIAGKKMGKMAKSKNIRRASKLFTSAAVLATIADGGDYGYGGEGGDEAGSEYVYCGEDDASVAVVEEQTAYQQQYVEAQQQYIDAQQQYVEPQQQYVETYAQPMESYAPIQPLHEQPALVQCEPYPTAIEPFTAYENMAYAATEPPVMMGSDVVITESITTTELTVDTTDTAATQDTFTATTETIVVTETTQSLIQDAFVPIALEAVAAECTTIATVEPLPTTAPLGQDAVVPPLVFEPVLPEPMMVNPPAASHGVEFKPNYAELI